ncbi:MAG: hypothetical protein EBS68_02355 [Rhodobacteraceae bacterium]|nr:hypothetical protein [Paracoccaceae bacterium]
MRGVFIAFGCVALVSGCAGGAGTTTSTSGSLPIKGGGKLLALKVPATTSISVNALTGLSQHNVDSVDGVTPTDQTSPGGVGFTVTGTADPAPAPFITNGAIVNASAAGALAGGTVLNGMTDAKGSVYFENGNFGDPQVETADAGVSTVGVYNPPGGAQQIVLTDATTIRYREGAAGSGSAVFGVGIIGNATTTMPAGQTITYRAFHEGGEAAYDNGTGVKNMYLSGDPTIVANLGTGKVTGGLANAKLQRWNGTANVDLAPTIATLDLDGTITGNTYAGTATFKDAGGADVGTQNSEMIGGFYGADAKNTALVFQSTGTMPIDGANSTYFLQGTMGGAK